jgi:uncharacterized membrane protein SpoIIM required for sporulation
MQEIREVSMVLESLTNPLRAEAHPNSMLLHGFIYATLGLFLGNWIFSDQSSLIMVFLTTMAAIPLVYNIIKLEEKKDLAAIEETNLLKEHSKALKVFMNYFFGATLAFALWYCVLSNSGSLFEVQRNTIVSLRAGVTGNAYNLEKVFCDILSNNLKVLIFCVLFSFIYGIGGLFILTWNASVIGVAIGDTIKTGIYRIGTSLHLFSSHEYVGAITYGLLRYSLHGVLEILAYFVAGLAGGIISTAVIRHDFGTKRYEKIIMDSSVLLLISLVMIVVAAGIEVYITPFIF